MNAIFLKVIELSIAAACIVVVILALRLLLHRRAPKWVMCALWILVAVRLVFPFTIESVLSMQPDIDNITSGVIDTTPPKNPAGDNSTVGSNTEHSGGQRPGNTDSNNTITQPGNSTVTQPGNSTVTQPGNNTVTQPGNNAVQPGNPGTTVDPEVQEPIVVERRADWIFILSIVWVVGMSAMAGYAICSVLVLRMRLRESTILEKGIRQNHSVDSPFVLGVFRPTIYLPYSLSPEDQEFVVAHERTHIRRGDHLWKPFGFLLLSIHWFNPLLWVAYVLLCRDIEAACDEKVISHYTKEERQAYSIALLNCSCNRKRIVACPVAFGEVGVKERIKGVMNYKKPSFWIVIVAILAAIVVAVTFLTSPPAGTEDGPSPSPLASPTATPTPNPTPESINYEIPPVKMEVVAMERDFLKVQFSLAEKFEGARVFTNGPFVLERLVDGTWETIDSSLVSLEAWIMEYPEFFSATKTIRLGLPEKFVNGQTYRISMPLTTDRDPSKGKEYTPSVEFVFAASTATGGPGYIGTKLEDIPEYYSIEWAVGVEGGFALRSDTVLTGGYVKDQGSKNFEGFLSLTSNGSSCEMRFATEYSDPHKVYFSDIVFDGSKYTIRTLVDQANKTIVSHDYKYLMCFEGQAETPDAKYDYYQRYVLTNSADVTWDDILVGKYTDYFVLYSDLVRYPNRPELDQNISRITLEYQGELAGEITSQNTCALVREILLRSTAHDMESGCSCGWYTVDSDLQMILWYENGEKVVINPIRTEEVFVMGDKHYKYTDYHHDAYYKSNNFLMRVILDCFGLKAWPTPAPTPGVDDRLNGYDVAPVLNTKYLDRRTIDDWGIHDDVILVTSAQQFSQIIENRGKDELLSTYNEDYFKDRVLILARFMHSSGSDQIHDILGVVVEDDRLYPVVENGYRGAGTDDIKYTIFLVEIGKEFADKSPGEVLTVNRYYEGEGTFKPKNAQ